MDDGPEDPPSEPRELERSGFDESMEAGNVGSASQVPIPKDLWLSSMTLDAAMDLSRRVHTSLHGNLGNAGKVIARHDVPNDPHVFVARNGQVRVDDDAPRSILLNLQGFGQSLYKASRLDPGGPNHRASGVAHRAPIPRSCRKARGIDIADPRSHVQFDTESG